MKSGLAALIGRVKKKGIHGLLASIYSRFINAFNRISVSLLKILPVKKNLMVLESEGDYTDNIRVFYEYMISNHMNEKYQIVWMVHDPSQYPKAKNVHFVSRFGTKIHWKANYYIATAHFFVFSHPYWLRKWRKNQIVIHTTHSASQLKWTETHQEKIADYILVCSDHIGDLRYKKFSLPRDHALTLGMPRIDLLYRHKDCISPLIPDYQNERIILAMPTMKKALNWNDSRIDVDYALNIVQSKEDLMRLDRFLKENNCYMIIKIHHLQDLTVLKTFHCQRILYIKDDDLQRHQIQVNELLENADVLLTDYSSVFFEYLLLDRPIGFLIADMDEYSRGFETDHPLDNMPGEKIANLDEFEKFITEVSGGIDPYGENRRIVRQKTFRYDDDKNAKRLMDWIETQNNCT